MSEDECRIADWQLIGFGDGTRGHPVSRISSHQQACAKVGVSPDLNAYTRGRDEGLLEYCTPQRGYQLGLRGSSYNAVCPTEREAQFSHGYSYGREIYIKQRELSARNAKLTREQEEYGLTVKLIDHKEKRLVEDGVTKKRRIQLLEELKQLGSELTYSEERQATLQQGIDDLRYDLDRLKRDNPYSMHQ